MGAICSCGGPSRSSRPGVCRLQNLWHLNPQGFSALLSFSGWSKEAETLRAPRVRTAFTAEQVSTLESAFQHHRYLGPLERRTLAREMRLSEAQVRGRARVEAAQEMGFFSPVL